MKKYNYKVYYIMTSRPKQRRKRQIRSKPIDITPSPNFEYVSVPKITRDTFNTSVVIVNDAGDELGKRGDTSEEASASREMLEDETELNSTKPRDLNRVRKEPEHKIIINSIDFPIDFNQKYAVYITNATRDIVSQQQKMLAKYILEPQVRGILLYHTVGSGKTRSALLMAEKLRRKTIIMAPASIKQNFIDEYKKMHPDREWPEHYKLISGNAPNTVGQLLQASFQLSELKKEGIRDTTFNQESPIDDITLIIDEVHNVISYMISGDSEKGEELFKIIYHTRRLKLIMLSGTCIVNVPFELSIVANLIQGPIITRIGTEVSILPLDNEKFTQMFTTDEPEPIDNPNTTKTIRNEELIKRRLVGMVSYFTGSHKSRDLYPVIINKGIIEVTMSTYQWNAYVKARQKEREREEMERRMRGMQFAEQSRSRKEKTIKISRKMSGAYKSNTRTVSNFALPPYVKIKHTDNPQQNAQIARKALEKIKTEDLEAVNLGTYSEKFKTILQIVENTQNEKTVIYSDYKELYGIKLFARILEANGWTNYNKQIELDQENARGPRQRKSVSRRGKRATPEESAESSAGCDAIGGEQQEYNEGDETTYVRDEVSDEEVEQQELTEDLRKEHENIVAQTRESGKYFALWHGEISMKERYQIKQVFNSMENNYGSLIRVLLITKAGSEGITLFSVRNIHIMEPYWHESRIKQVIGRTYRLNSHKMLPPEKRNVKVYRYSSIAPPEGEEFISFDNGLTTDQEIYNIAYRKEELLEHFRKVMIESSIDCRYNISNEHKGQYACLSCVPSSILNIPHSTPMYDIILERDAVIPSNCIPPVYLRNPKIILQDEKERLGFNTTIDVYHVAETGKYYIKVAENQYVEVKPSGVI